MPSTFSLFYGPQDAVCAIPFTAFPEAMPAAGLAAGIFLAKAYDIALFRRLALPDRRQLLSSLEVREDRVFAIHQVHSTRVIVVDHQEPESLITVEADGMVSSRPDAVLTTSVADCLPIFLADEATGAFGLVHSGWKGTGIVLEAIRVMTEAFGTSPRNVVAAIGPGIGPCCYTVQQDRYEKFRVEFGDAAVTRGPSGDFRLDLKTANMTLLEAAGVYRIVVTADCTCCSPALGSFRREGQGFSRMLAFIGRVPGIAFKAWGDYPKGEAL
jgi:hypothetical protein